MHDETLTGQLLVAAPALSDGTFDRTIVLVLDHDAHGAIGVILNQPSETTVAEAMPAWHDRVASPRLLFVGGPVAPTTPVAVARVRPGAPDPSVADPSRVAGWTAVRGQIGVIDLLADPDAAADLDGVRLFAGYAGWSAGQLEGELAVGAWFVVDALDDDVLDPDPEQLWSRVLRRQRGDLALLARYPADPSLN